MRKKRIMVIGPSRCGKTTLVNELNNYQGELKRTQDMIYGKNTIDVPGSYIENSWMYKHIIAAAQDASHVLILIDQSRCTDVYPHGFAKSFRCPVIGVITKCDLMPENKENCLRQLRIIGVPEPYFHISVSKRIGIDDLKEYLLKEG
ncbi:EutP/PduV family microcompartment system protein [Clostridium sp. MB05]|uniref:EutP/PduV family microcompartment system protein n=1 Tax=Clostridium sp. MB05 TaxID=3376682 RepID=UPI003982BE64